MECSSCSKQKHTLKPRKSKLLDSVTLYLCEDCFSKKMEPRYLIILVGRAQGHAAVTDYIRNRRYIGEEILAKEIV